MKRLASTALLALAALGAALAYQAAARDRDYRALLGRGDTALMDDQTSAAVEAYSGAIGLRPGSMLAHLRRGEAYRAQGDADAAVRDFHRAVTLDPTATRPLEDLGDVLYQRAWYERAAEAYEDLLRLDDSTPHVAYKLALARYRDGNIAGALGPLEQTLDLNDRDPDAYYLLGMCLRDMRRAPEALQALEKAVALSPGFIAAREELADVYGEADRFAEELEQLQVLAGLDRARAERHVAVGLAHARAARAARPPGAAERHLDLAVLTLSDALERTTDQSLIYGALGRVWLDVATARNDQAALRKAIEALERVSSGPTATSEVLTLYGRALLRDNRPQAAERALQRAIQHYPVDPSALLTYAAVAEQQSHPAAARSALMEYGAVASEESDFASRAAAIGRLSLQLNDVLTAADWLQRASEANPRDLDSLAALAETQVKLGYSQQARATVARGLEHDPGHAGLLAVSGRLR